MSLSRKQRKRDLKICVWREGASKTRKSGVQVGPVAAVDAGEQVLVVLRGLDCDMVVDAGVGALEAILEPRGQVKSLKFNGEITEIRENL